LLIADSPEALSRAVIDLMRDRERRRRLGLAARTLAQSRHDWQRIAPLLEHVYEG
jgi:glycosyltransferase involved in cell wall biosynthesis